MVLQLPTADSLYCACNSKSDCHSQFSSLAYSFANKKPWKTCYRAAAKYPVHSDTHSVKMKTDYPQKYERLIAQIIEDHESGFSGQ